MSKKGKHSKRRNEEYSKKVENKNEYLSYDKPRDEKEEDIIDKVELENNGKNNKNNIIRIIIFLVCLSIFLFSTINLARWAYYNIKSKELNNNLSRTAFKQTTLNDNEVKENNSEDANQNEIIKSFDLNSLKKVNEDAVGWIHIEGTNIDYPIVQAKDNDYYLHKDFNKEYSILGSIFMDWKNSDTFIDRNTVIYGHNIKSGMMFADLKNIYNGKLGQEIYIDIYTSTSCLKYKVYSSYMTDPEDYAIKSGIVKADEEQKYINEILKRSTIKYNVVPDKEDKLLTLSTCDSTGNKRILVHASLVSSVENN